MKVCFLTTKSLHTQGKKTFTFLASQEGNGVPFFTGELIFRDLFCSVFQKVKKYTL